MLQVGSPEIIGEPRHYKTFVVRQRTFAPVIRRLEGGGISPPPLQRSVSSNEVGFSHFGRRRSSSMRRCVDSEASSPNTQNPGIFAPDFQTRLLPVLAEAFATERTTKVS